MPPRHRPVLAMGLALALPAAAAAQPPEAPHVVDARGQACRLIVRQAGHKSFPTNAYDCAGARHSIFDPALLHVEDAPRAALRQDPETRTDLPPPPRNPRAERGR